jgi:hypothetical protein
MSFVTYLNNTIAPFLSNTFPKFPPLSPHILLQTPHLPFSLSLPPSKQLSLKMTSSNHNSIKKTQTRKQIIPDTVKILIVVLLSLIIKQFEEMQGLIMVVAIGWIVAEMAEFLDTL